MPFKYNPFTGTLDYNPPKSTMNSATSLQVTRTALEEIFSGECVMSSSASEVRLATNDQTVDKALVLGIAVNHALPGENVTVVIMGVINNSNYSAFTLNSPLFLDSNGGITDVRPVLPTSKYLLQVAKSLGSNSIFIQIETPTQLA